MKKTVLAAIALVAIASAPAFAEDPAALAGKYSCLACHSVDHAIVGPAYKDVAAKYRGDQGAEARLFQKVRHGGSGVWGQVAMPPNPGVPDADLHAILKWVLSRH